MTAKLFNVALPEVDKVVAVVAPVTPRAPPIVHASTTPRELSVAAPLLVRTLVEVKPLKLRDVATVAPSFVVSMPMRFVVKVIGESTAIAGWSPVVAILTTPKVGSS